MHVAVAWRAFHACTYACDLKDEGRGRGRGRGKERERDKGGDRRRKGGVGVGCCGVALLCVCN